MKIRKAKKDDVKDILRLNQKLFDYEYSNFDKTLDCDWAPKNKDYFKKAIEEDNSLAVVAVSNGKIIGYLVGSVSEAEDYRQLKTLAEVNNTFVDEDYRNKGVGSKLFREFLDWAKNKGMKRMKVVASAKNNGAINFYKTCGFSDYNLILEGDI